MAFMAPGVREKELLHRAPASPGGQVSLLESLGHQAALALAHLHTVHFHTLYSGVRDWRPGPLMSCWFDMIPTPQERLPEDQDTAAPKSLALVTTFGKGTKEL